jgi:septal ring factor EnvC (AmiA/AmiB activator)
MSQEPESAGFTPSQRFGLDTHRADQDRTLEAIHQLEDALGSPAPGREAPWLRNVRSALAALQDATNEEQRNANQVDSLLSDISRTQPRLRHRVHGLRTQYQHLRDAIESLHDELANPDERTTLDFADVRERLAWLVTALRHQRSRESDLIYEAYYDAFHTDIETTPGS